MRTKLCVCGVDSFIPELEHLIEFFFHGLFSTKKPLPSEIGFMESDFFRSKKLDYSDYLENEAKSEDMAVLELTFRKVSLGKWSKNWSGYRRKALNYSIFVRL